ncbi:MAG: PQQ-binding-like beta-propeller repeat protein [Armatimonadetes bacterium]|nr:PQQ-binding-like beta-propeller repeat protein [Armatimonadota bacterium]
MLSKNFFASSLTLAIVASALAIDGPLPLSWRWFAKTSYAPITQPALSDGSVFVAVGRRVYGLDAMTGNPKWMFPAGEEASGDFSTSPAVVGDAVIAGNTNHFVYAINKGTGATLWSFNLGTTNARNVVAGDNALYVFTGDDRVVALDPANGAKTWSADYQIEGNAVGDPLYVGGRLIYFTSSGKLTGLNVARSKPDWQVSVQSANIDGGPVSFGQSVYVISGSQVAQINPLTGRTGWVARFPARLAAGAAVSEKGGAVATEDGNVYTFDLTGRNVSKEPVKLNGYIAGSPQAAGNGIFVRMRGGSLVLIDPSRKDNKVIWEYTMSAIVGAARKTTVADGKTGETIDYVSILGPLALSDKSVYGLADDGSLFAWGGAFGVDEIGPTIKMLNPPMGATLWGQPDTDFYFKLDDPQTGIMSKSIHITMNGGEMKHDFKQGSGYLFARIRHPGSTEPGANAPLNDGRKTIVVTASDWAGNVTEKTFTVTIDNTVFDKPPAPPTSGGGVGPARGGGGRGGGN